MLMVILLVEAVRGGCIGFGLLPIVLMVPAVSVALGLAALPVMVVTNVKKNDW